MYRSQSFLRINETALNILQKPLKAFFTGLQWYKPVMLYTHCLPARAIICFLSGTSLNLHAHFSLLIKVCVHDLFLRK